MSIVNIVNVFKTSIFFFSNTENSDEGSDTQSIIMDNSDNMDSLGVENGSSSPMLNL